MLGKAETENRLNKLCSIKGGSKMKMIESSVFGRVVLLEEGD